MECNKDEATRAKAIAESKLEQKDYVGAKKFALKAQNLYPGIDGISQMVIVLEVYLRAENMIRGEVDCYQVLDVHPLADDDTIKKQYKKLSLLLHPDKNTSIGAVGAFQLISDAHRLLKDKQLREAYNQRTQSVPPGPTEQKVPSAPTRRSRKTGPLAPTRRSRKTGPSAPPRQSQKVPAHAGGSSAPPQSSQDTAPAQTSGSSTPSMSTQFFNCASRKNPTPKSQNRRSKVPMTPKPATFWTICGFCHIQFEYYQKYCQRALLCQECYTPFLAKDIGLPKFSGSGPVPWQRKSQSANFPSQNACGNVAAAEKRGAGQTTPDSFMNTNCQQGPGSVFTDPLETVNLKRSRTESHASGGWEGGSKKGKLDYDNNINGINYYVAQGNSDLGSESAFGTGTYGFSGTHDHPSSTKKLTPLRTKRDADAKGSRGYSEEAVTPF